MRERVCVGCGSALPPAKKNDNRRKWCSDLCRKRTLYSGQCIDCGARTNGSDGRGPNAAKRCKGCGDKAAAERQRQRFAEQRATVERLWAEGLPAKEIGARMGWTANPHAAIGVLRKRGYDLPRRHNWSDENLARAAERMRANRQAA